VKPHSTRELLLRVRALARRKSDPPKNDSLKVGQLRIDVAARQAWNDKQRVDLTRRELDVLIMLAERAGRVQTREVLVADIWGDDVNHSGRIVDTTIKRLRRKIASAGCAIKTVRGVGYKLVSAVDDA
jgi:two-component system phosphate regulon response regulator PhoB